MDSFEIICPLGEGTFANVFKVKKKSDQTIYAIKKVFLGTLERKDVLQTLNEIRFLASIHHPNIVGFYECFQVDHHDICIVLEYCPYGDLGQEIQRQARRKCRFEEHILWNIFVQILKALRVLHKNNIVHRDVKSANCFVGEGGIIKLGDMNISKRIKGGILLQTQTGTPYYMSPEIWCQRPYDQSSDIWALGVLLYELAMLKKPFTASSFPELRAKILCADYPPLKSLYSLDVQFVVAWLLKVEPSERPTACDLLNSPVILQHCPEDFICDESQEQTELLKTIHVPEELENLDFLEDRLPRPNYPDESYMTWSEPSRRALTPLKPAPEILRQSSEGKLCHKKSFNDLQEKRVRQSDCKSVLERNHKIQLTVNVPALGSSFINSPVLPPMQESKPVSPKLISRESLASARTRSSRSSSRSSSKVFSSRPGRVDSPSQLKKTQDNAKRCDECNCGTELFSARRLSALFQAFTPMKPSDKEEDKICAGSPAQLKVPPGQLKHSPGSKRLLREKLSAKDEDVSQLHRISPSKNTRRSLPFERKSFSEHIEESSPKERAVEKICRNRYPMEEGLRNDKTPLSRAKRVAVQPSDAAEPELKSSSQYITPIKNENFKTVNKYVPVPPQNCTKRTQFCSDASVMPTR